MLKILLIIRYIKINILVKSVTFINTSGYAPGGLEGHVKLFLSIYNKVSYLPKIFFSALVLKTPQFKPSQDL